MAVAAFLNDSRELTVRYVHLSPLTILLYCLLNHFGNTLSTSKIMNMATFRELFATADSVSSIETGRVTASIC